MSLKDVRLLFATRIARLFAYGFLSVVLVLYMAEVGLTENRIGLLLTLTLFGDTIISLLITTTADRIGRKAMLLVGAALMIFAGILFALTRNFLLLAGGILAQSLQGAGMSSLSSYRIIVLVYSAMGALLTFMFAWLSPAAEAAVTKAPPNRLGLHRSRRIVLKLSLLFTLDAFAGGLILQSVVAYWFHLRYGVQPAALGGIFFGGNILAGVSALSASWLAKPPIC